MMGNFERSFAKMKEEGKTIVPYFKNRGIKSVIAYGTGYCYNFFVSEMKQSDLNVIPVDKSGNPDKGVYLPKDLNRIQAELIVITSVLYFDEIYKKLRHDGETRPIVSFQELIYNTEMELL